VRLMILLQPVGTVDRGLIKTLEQGIASIFGAAEVGPATRVPASAYVRERDQFDGEKILYDLSLEGEVTLGITEVDIFVKGLNFVFGLADDRRALISLRRLRQEFYELQEDGPLLELRALKEVVHELGHVFGLAHCPERRCVMYFSNSILDTDFKDWRYCRGCAEILRRSGLMVRL